MRYFVEAKTTDAVERVNEFLASIGHTPEWSSNQEDTAGNLHQVCEVYTLQNAKRIRSAERADSRVIVEYWKREETGGARLESARFLVVTAPTMRIRRQRKYRAVAAQLPQRN